MNITEIHEKVYQILMSERQRDSSLMFSFRKSNHAGRLEDGYWFYGNDKYLAVSFWTGMDWKNKTPNIIFLIIPGGSCLLQVNVSDDSRKREFVEKFMIGPLPLHEAGKRFEKHYGPSEDYAELLIQFLRRDRLTIDELLRSEANNFFRDWDGIGFFTEEEFQKRLQKVEWYRNKREEIDFDYNFSFDESTPSFLRSLTIKGYGPIRKIDLDLESGSRKPNWIFLVGENGSGKTLFLKSIATVLGNKVLTDEMEYSKFAVDLTFDTNDEFQRRFSTAVKRKKQITRGLAMYGPYRLELSKKLTQSQLKRRLGKEGSFKSLFDDGIPLIDPVQQFDLWAQERSDKSAPFEERKYFLRNVITSLVTGLVNIIFSDETKSGYTEFYFEDSDNPVIWENLSSGNRSLIALLGDIMIRLYHQQPRATDPAEMTGVVLIDEIDLHLHPRAQMDIVQGLSDTFYNVQFFVSTHSPIPLLAAKKNSIIIRMKRQSDQIEIERLDQKIAFEKLLPNALLTSPIFGLYSFVKEGDSGYTERKERVRAEDFYQDVIFDDLLDQSIKDFLSSKKERELINLFKDKDEEN